MTIDYDAGVRNPGHAQTARIPGKTDAHVTPRFYSEMRKTDQIDGETGLPVFTTVEFVELLIAGDKGNAPTKRVTPAIKLQYADAYARWKATEINPDMIGDGIPLTLWPLIPTQVAKGLEYINVFTVQQLAGLSDAQMSKPGTIGLRDFRDKARTFMESAKTTAPIAKLEAENGEMRKRIELMQEQMAQLIAASEAQRVANATGSVATPIEQPPDLSTPRSRKGN